MALCHQELQVLSTVSHSVIFPVDTMITKLLVPPPSPILLTSAAPFHHKKIATLYNPNPTSCPVYPNDSVTPKTVTSNPTSCRVSSNSLPKILWVMVRLLMGRVSLYVRPMSFQSLNLAITELPTFRGSASTYRRGG